MIIRTIEDHLKLNTDEKLQYSNYLPVSLAYLLPCLFQTSADVSKMTDEESCRAEMKVVQTILDSNPNLTVKGFNPSHKCRLDYNKNLRTFAEAHQNIDGKPSIGIQFTDADDGYNDWVWIAVDVIRDFRYTTLSFRSDETERLYSEIKRMSGPKPEEPEKPKEIDTQTSVGVENEKVDEKKVEKEIRWILDTFPQEVHVKMLLELVERERQSAWEDAYNSAELEHAETIGCSFDD